MPVRTTRFTGGRGLFSAGSQSPEPGGLATRLSSGYGQENTAQSTTRHLPRVLRDAHGMLIMSGAASQAFLVITCCLLHRVRQCRVLPMARFAIADGAAGEPAPIDETAWQEKATVVRMLHTDAFLRGSVCAIYGR